MVQPTPPPPKKKILYPPPYGYYRTRLSSSPMDAVLPDILTSDSSRPQASSRMVSAWLLGNTNIIEAL